MASYPSLSKKDGIVRNICKGLKIKYLGLYLLLLIRQYDWDN